MSTDTATEGPDLRPRTKCFMCGMLFVSHSEYEQLVKFPDNICVWCFSRKDLYQRFMSLYDGLQSACKTHDRTCHCKSCILAKSSRKAFKAR